MDRSWWWKLSLIVAVTVGSLWFLVPTYYSFVVLPRAQRNNIEALEKALPAWAPAGAVPAQPGPGPAGRHPHGDARGHQDGAAEARRAPRHADRQLPARQEAGRGDRGRGSGAARAHAHGEDPATMDAIEKEVLDASRTSPRGREGDKLVLALDDSQVDRFQDEAVDQAMLVIRRRIESGAWPRWTCASWARTPSDLPPGPSGPGAGQGADRHHRAARVPAGGRHQPRVLPRDCSRRTRRPRRNITCHHRRGLPQLVVADREALLAYVEGQGAGGPRGAAGVRGQPRARRASARRTAPTWWRRTCR